MAPLAERRLTRRRAAALLGLSERQVRRLYRAFTRAGAVGLASRRRGRPSNRRLPDPTCDQALSLIRERYADFGPTFALPKLTEAHGLTLSVETLRGWMIAAGLWVPRAQRTRRSYPPRPRRACHGEFVQIDGSEHAWFRPQEEQPVSLLHGPSRSFYRGGSAWDPGRRIEVAHHPIEAFDSTRAGREDLGGQRLLDRCKDLPLAAHVEQQSLEVA